MSHPQSSPRGLFAKAEINIPSSVGNGRLLGPAASLPSSDEGIAAQFISNSTGVAVALNTTGTTWKYLSITSVQAT